MLIRRKLSAVPALSAVLLSGCAALAQKVGTPLLKLQVDETQAFRKIAYVHETIRVRPGVLTLAYPKWIPGEHGPTGPIYNVAAISVRAGDAKLAWTRDPDDIFQIKVTVPAKVETITVEFATLAENTISDKQILLNWNTVLLYPRGLEKRDLMIEPTLLLPKGWKQGSSLAVTSEADGSVSYGPTSLERLIDSPVLAGEYLRAVPLTSKWPAELDFTGDSQKAVDNPENAHGIELFSKLIDQDEAMFGYRHWDRFHLLVSQSDQRKFDGLEHEASPYDGIPADGLANKKILEMMGWPLLAHEQSHSWDGKYRRAAEMYSKPDYQGPERTSLLWVYEGLNEYIGMLLATRSGFNDAGYARDYWALTAGDYEATPARAVTPLVDTATENWVLRGVSGNWEPLRRSQDYYDEGALIWLHADAIIRRGTGGKVTLDDFLHRFLGVKDTGAVVNPYTREEVEADLNATYKYDWHGLFEKHVYQPNPLPPTEGFVAAGWKLVYTEAAPRDFFWSLFPGGPSYFAESSLGVLFDAEGKITDMAPGTPAYKAGLGPGMTVLAVDGHKFSSAAMDEAIAHPKDGKITLLVKSYDAVQTIVVEYAGGLRYPHLQRIDGMHDYLTEILAPKDVK